MGRRFLQIGLCLAAVAACKSRSHPEAERGEAVTPIEHVTPSAAVTPSGPPDASPPVDAEPIKPTDVISGNAAEQLIAEQVTPGGADAGAEPVADLTITPRGVGPFRLGQTRREVLRRMGANARSTKLDTDPGAPTLEYLDYFGAEGARLLRVKLYAARVSEIVVYTQARHAMTDQDVAIGTSFEDAILAHGPARRVEGGKDGRARGWVLGDLPGVIFVPDDPDVLELKEVPPAARVGRIIVVGPEVD